MRVDKATLQQEASGDEARGEGGRQLKVREEESDRPCMRAATDIAFRYSIAASRVVVSE